MTPTDAWGQPVGEPVDWAGAQEPGPVVLEGENVRLEPLAAGHAEGIVTALAPHPTVWTYGADEPPGDTAAAARWLAEESAATDRLTFAIMPRSTDHLEGLASYLRIDAANGSIEVGSIKYAPTLQRTRAATEAMYLLARHAFDELGYRRYEWKCDSLNQPSRSAALRLGFVEEGTFRHAMVYKGRNRDTTWFSITDREWPQVRTALEQWLDEGNFDGDGRQRRSLVDLRHGVSQRGTAR